MSSPFRKLKSITSEPWGTQKLLHTITLECGHVTERTTYGKWRPRGLRCKECLPSPPTYTAADLARARREALEYGARELEEHARIIPTLGDPESYVIADAYKDAALLLRHIAEDPTRALTGTPDALRCKCGHSIDAHQSERSSHCLTKGCECAQWAGTPDATKEET